MRHGDTIEVDIGYEGQLTFHRVEKAEPVLV
jgi:hypothetical protein